VAGMPDMRVRGRSRGLPAVAICLICMARRRSWFARTTASDLLYGAELCVNLGSNRS
jgi:hypothetical protein